jgi:hypothetical protein
MNESNNYLSSKFHTSGGQLSNTEALETLTDLFNRVELLKNSDEKKNILNIFNIEKDNNKIKMALKENTLTIEKTNDNAFNIQFNSKDRDESFVFNKENPNLVVLDNAQQYMIYNLIDDMQQRLKKHHQTIKSNTNYKQEDYYKDLKKARVFENTGFIKKDQEWSKNARDSVLTIKDGDFEKNNELKKSEYKVVAYYTIEFSPLIMLSNNHQEIHIFHDNTLRLIMLSNNHQEIDIFHDNTLRIKTLNDDTFFNKYKNELYTVDIKKLAKDLRKKNQNKKAFIAKP